MCARPPRPARCFSTRKPASASRRSKRASASSDQTAKTPPGRKAARARASARTPVERIIRPLRGGVRPFVEIEQDRVVAAARRASAGGRPTSRDDERHARIVDGAVGERGAAALGTRRRLRGSARRPSRARWPATGRARRAACSPCRGHRRARRRRGPASAARGCAAAAYANASSLRRACEVMSTRPAMVMRKSAVAALSQLERALGLFRRALSSARGASCLTG